MKKNKISRSLLDIVVSTICLVFFCILIICIVKSFREEELAKEQVQQIQKEHTKKEYILNPSLPLTVDDRIIPKEKDKNKHLKSNDEIANDIIDGKYGDGIERIKRLKKEGYDVSAIQELVDKKLSTNVIYEEDVQYNSEDIVYENEEQYYPNSSEALNAYNGEVQYNGHRETYYSQQVLPGEGLNIPGRHVAEDGTVRDSDGYICVAANESYLPYGSIVETSLGKAKVYDSGCDYGTIDIYTNW